MEKPRVRNFAPCSESLPALMDFIVLSAAELGLPHSASLRLQLVAEELFTNTFRHSHCAVDGATVSLGIERSGEAVALTYEDAEAAWNPLQARDPAHLHLPLEQRPVGGLGIVLIDGFADKVEYERVDERNRLRVWMRCA